MTELLLSKAHYPVTVLGPGKRAGIWVQGCTIGCPGCISRDTWEADPSTAVPVEAILGWLVSLPGRVDGVTISGGEPFQQRTALAALLRGIHEWRRARAERADILVYSGYSYSRLSRSAESREILDLCDAVMAGPYVDRRNDGSPLRGSSNQRLVPLTDLGRERYGRLSGAGADTVSDDEAEAGPRMQVSVQDGPDGRHVYYIGIPGRGDMEQLNAALERAGIRAGDVSWRP